MSGKRQRSKGTGTLFRRVSKGPWVARWFDESGSRREVSTHTTDKSAAERILAKRIADAAIRRDGVIDAKQARMIDAAQHSLAEHLNEYERHLIVHINRKTGFIATEHHRTQRLRHLRAIAAALRWSKLDDLDR